ncbi:MAG: response regulator [Planctomycetota bacterium]|nr:response regulator [Planctomycetota bacterium]
MKIDRETNLVESIQPMLPIQETFSHDFRNPLAAMQNAVDVIKLDVGISNDSSLMLEILDRQIKYLLRMIADLATKDSGKNSQQTRSAALSSSIAVNQIVSRTREILVVDDTRSICVTFKLMLEKLGHNVRTASDGETALLAIRQRIPDIVFSDICMEGMDGFELARKIRSMPQYSGIRLIGLTGTVTHESKTASLSAGFDELFEKPINFSILAEALNLMDRPRFSGS